MLISQAEAESLATEMAADQRKAVYYILNYTAEIAALQEAKEKYLNANKREVAGGGAKNKAHGDPTAKAALQNILFAEKYPPCLWLKAVEAMEKNLTPEKKIFLAIRRQAENLNRGKGKRQWVVYVQQRYMAALSQDRRNHVPYVGIRTVKTWWRDMVGQVVENHLRFSVKKKSL